MAREPSGSPAGAGTNDTSGPDRAGPGLPAFLNSWALSALIVALAIAQQAAGHLNGDDSWFILFAERVANGARAYVDISDPNPPAGFLIYMPAVLLARALTCRRNSGPLSKPSFSPSCRSNSAAPFWPALASSRAKRRGPCAMRPCGSCCLRLASPLPSANDSR